MASKRTVTKTGKSERTGGAKVIKLSGVPKPPQPAPTTSTKNGGGGTATLYNVPAESSTAYSKAPRRRNPEPILSDDSRSRKGAAKTSRSSVTGNLSTKQATLRAFRMTYDNAHTPKADRG